MPASVVSFLKRGARYRRKGYRAPENGALSLWDEPRRPSGPEVTDGTAAVPSQLYFNSLDSIKSFPDLCLCYPVHLWASVLFKKQVDRIEKCWLDSIDGEAAGKEWYSVCTANRS